jgi:ferric-dicitrate binding protein FerR (iron transport regulator)
MEKYLRYTTDDFVMDDDFREWALARSSSDLAPEWQNFIMQHPEKKAEIEEAVFILKGFSSIQDTTVPEKRIQDLWNKINQKKTVRISVISQPFMRYVAVFVVALFIGSMGYKLIDKLRDKPVTAYNEIIIPYGERSEIALYDGTKVWLNSGTRLKFPTSFQNKERRVYLDGEAYFEVTKKGDSQPFIVSTPSMDIKVLGTHFNVNAYAEDHQVAATLEEGKIVAINNRTKLKTELAPGDQLSLDISTGQVIRRKVDTQLFTSWKENLLRFQDATFDDVIQKMERWYDVDIIVDKGMKVSKLYTMTIKTESLREMLDLLTYTTSMKYEIDQNKVFIGRP